MNTQQIGIFRPLAGGFTLFLLFLFGASSPASAGITFDRSSSSAVALNTHSISWSHTIGNGADRALVVAVSIDDFILFKSEIETVRFNGIAMHAAPNAHAVSWGLLIQETQIFYLTGDELPTPGSYEIAVNFTGKIDIAAGGAVSLFGVQPGAPVAAVTNDRKIGTGPIKTTIDAPADSWVDDIASCESN